MVAVPAPQRIVTSIVQLLMWNFLQVAIAKGHVISAGMTLLDLAQRLELGIPREIEKIALFLIQPPDSCDGVSSRERQEPVTVVDR